MDHNIEYMKSSRLDTGNNSVVAVVDSLVWDKYEDLITGWIGKDKIFVFSAVENKKRLETAENLFTFFQLQLINRDSVILAIGGGITSDLAGFCAATYMRGCRLWLMPTTFTGMIDAAIGGKNGLNFDEIKNNIGTFYCAEKILIYPAFLDTLFEEDIKCGWAECVKVALLKPDLLYEDILKSQHEITEDIIAKAIEAKLYFVNNDLIDKGTRRFLNFGHTFGHLIESITDYQIPHGIAVSIGMRMAIKLSFDLQMIDEEIQTKMLSLLDFFDFPKKVISEGLSVNDQLLEEILCFDKKAGIYKKKVVINIVLIKGWGEPIITSVSVKKLLKLFKEFLPPNSYSME